MSQMQAIGGKHIGKVVTVFNENLALKGRQRPFA
jgi:hypothetical protein